MADLRPDIERALDWMNALQRTTARREIKSLEGKLANDETVERIVQGRYEGKEGLAVLTNRRVFFSEEGMTRSRIEDFPLKSISTIQHQTSLLSGSLTLFASGNKAVIDNVVPKQHAVTFADAVRERLAEAAGAALAPGGPQESVAADPIEKLKKLAELRDAGVISPAEFEEKKRGLLDQV